MDDKPAGSSDTVPPSSWLPSVGRALAFLLAVTILGPQPVVLPLAGAFRAAQEAQVRQDYAAQADALAEAAVRMPYASHVVYRAGLAEISAGRFDAAIRHISAAAELDGWTYTRHTALGDAYSGLGQVEAALAEWELALAENSQDQDLLARLATNYERAGRYSDAIEILSRLVQLRNGDVSAYYRLALLTAATDPPAALARLAVLSEIRPEYGGVASVLRAAIEAGSVAGERSYLFARVGFAFVQLDEWGLAELALGQAIAADPGYADAHAYLGLASDMQGKDGRRSYDTALELDPDSPLISYLLGLHWRRLGDSRSALPYLEKAFALDPSNPALAAEIGGAYGSMGDLLLAERWLVDAVRLGEQDPAFWLLLARFYIDNEFNVAEAGLPAARMAVGLRPDSALAADALGHALVLTGDTINGRKMLERALALDPTLASAHYHLGLLMARQGAWLDAEALLQRTLALDPEGPYGRMALRALAELPP
jgi:tetratricopeptide (TPR) repeat protein